MHDREKVVRESIQMIGADSFPDDDVAWNILNIQFREEYAFVESAPSPATVGYERFIFVLRLLDDQSYAVAGCYCRNQNRWDLLFTDPKERDNWKNLFNGV